VMDHLEKGTLDLSDVKFVVLDEADEMLNMGFAEDVETILKTTPQEKQVALFSATMPPQIRRIAKKYAPDAVEITVKNKTRTAENVSQRYLFVSYPQKVDALTRILETENFDGMIVFVRTKQATEDLAERLRARGFSAAAINGDVVQTQRERTIESLRKSKLDILVATDVAARGLDVERISHVVNFDIPTDTEAYVHRIGRTGRAGRNGDAISFVTPREKHLLRSIEKATRQPITEMRKPSVEDVNATRVAKFTEAITQALGDEQMPTFRELVTVYESEHDVPAADIAAAIAILAQSGEPLLIADEPEPVVSREGRERRTPGSGLSTWKVAVGKRHRVEPRQIVGALANEGGLRRGDFGRIDIKPNFSLVELPSDLSEATLSKLASTRISGVLIDLKPDAGGRPARGPERRSGPSSRPSRADHGQGAEPYKKPRHKHRDT
ncbi:MAG: helicase-related protein, partial [Marmoricola sp.]